MRTGGNTLHHSLTPDSTTIVKQAVTLARRRGHSQVTPLHVASAMLSSTTGLLKRACLQSHSHPLQCKALELCFNVAINRLPTSVPSPLLGPNSHLPSLSNALVAAFKRAQAHQRRGSIENQQQQSILALKVEIEQLVISILDDPSVSRVMREAGFSSTQVKSNVEQALTSLETCKPQPKELSPEPLLLGKRITQIPYNQKHVQNDDVMSVLDAMMNKRTKNTVIIVESQPVAENVVKGVIDKFDKKDIPVEMRFVQFISVPLYTLRNISREEFEVKLVELRSLVKSHVNTGVVLYLGDLHWVSEFWSKYGEKNGHGYYSPVEYMIMELSRLICGAGDNRRLWIMGTATSRTYAKCRIGRPSLETLWSLSPITLPVGTLTLSLSLDHSEIRDYLKEPLDDFNWLFQKAGIKNQLNCCSDCLVNFKREAQGVMSAKQDVIPTSSNSSLPLWLKQYKDENVSKRISDDQGSEKLKYLCEKWNSICSSVHRKPHFLEKILNISTPSPSSSTSVSSNDHKPHESLLNWPDIFKPSRTPDNEHQILLCENETEVSKPAKPDLLSNPNSSPNSASSSEANEDMKLLQEFKEFTPDNLEILCNALENKVPWQKEIIPDIATTILKCRSRIMKTESWMCFLGVDSDGKETIARELAKILFGSHDNFVTISMSSFLTTRADSNEEVSDNKRARDEHGASPYERFLDALRDNPSRVFFIEDVDQFDYSSLKGFKKVIENGSFTHHDEEIVRLKDAIVIFSCMNFSTSRTCSSPPTAKEFDELEEKENDNGGVLDLNIATEDGDEEADNEIGILGLVDKQVVFKIQFL